MRPSRRLAFVAVVAALALAACLPASVRPTPTTGPTPTPAPTTPPTPSPTPGPPTPTPAPTFALYTVVRGDRLLTVAKRFGTTGRSVAYWNRQTYPTLDPESAGYNPDRLEVGWVLRILPGQEFQKPMDAGESPDPTPSGEPSSSAGETTAPTDEPLPTAEATAGA